MRVRDELARVSGTDPQDWYLVSKARHAMTLVLGALEPGEVVTQPLTCLTAVAPVLSAGHTPVYADLDPGTLAMDPALLGAVTTPRTRAVVAQHTFGAAAPLAELREAAPEGAMLLEDAAHCLGELARGSDGAPLADVSVHSFGVEKILPTRLGAACWVNPAGSGMPWHARVVTALLGLGEPGVRGRASQLLSRPVTGLARRLGGPGQVGVALAARAGVVDTPIMPAELQGRVAGTPSALTGPALVQVAEALGDLEANRAHRRTVATLYREGLAEVAGAHTPAALDEPGRVLVRYPVLLDSAATAQESFRVLEARGAVPGRWYRPLLFPGPGDPDAFGYRPGSCPVAEDVSARILNLPTAGFVTEAAARGTVAAVRDLVG